MPGGVQLCVPCTVETPPCVHAAISWSCLVVNLGVAMPTEKSLVGLLQGLSRGISGQIPDSEQVEQLQSELQQRCGQVQKLNADLEYSQDKLQDLQRHCHSLEVRMLLLP